MSTFSYAQVTFKNAPFPPKLLPSTLFKSFPFAYLQIEKNSVKQFFASDPSSFSETAGKTVQCALQPKHPLCKIPCEETCSAVYKAISDVEGEELKTLKYLNPEKKSFPEQVTELDKLASQSIVDANSKGGDVTFSVSSDLPMPSVATDEQTVAPKNEQEIPVTAEAVMKLPKVVAVLFLVLLLNTL